MHTLQLARLAFAALFVVQLALPSPGQRLAPRLTAELIPPASGLYDLVPAFSEELAVLGDAMYGGVGAAHVFRKGRDGSWQFDQLIVHPEPISLRFGSAVARVGTSWVIGANAVAYEFESQGGALEQSQRLAGVDSYWMPGAYGRVLAADGDVMAISGASATEVHVFERAGAGAPWVRVKKLEPEPLSGFLGFGEALAVHGDRIVVGAYTASLTAERSGAAYVYERDHPVPGAWGEVQILTGKDTNKDDAFGFSVALSEDRLVIGAPWRTLQNAEQGAVYVFEPTDEKRSWKQVAKLTAVRYQKGEGFGQRVATGGDVLLVGIPLRYGGLGAVTLYRRGRDSSEWNLEAEFTVPANSSAKALGSSLSLEGNAAMLGARRSAFVLEPLFYAPH